MSWQKTHDLAVRTGTYQGNDGKDKGRYENVGHILRDGDQKMLLLKRTFNPAGVPNPDGRDTVILSVFEVRDQANEQRAITRSESQVQRREAAPQAAADFNDDIPFAFAFLAPLAATVAGLVHAAGSMLA